MIDYFNAVDFGEIAGRSGRGLTLKAFCVIVTKTEFDDENELLEYNRSSIQVTPRLICVVIPSAFHGALSWLLMKRNAWDQHSHSLDAIKLESVQFIIVKPIHLLY